MLVHGTRVASWPLPVGRHSQELILSTPDHLRLHVLYFLRLLTHFWYWFGRKMSTHQPSPSPSTKNDSQRHKATQGVSGRLKASQTLRLGTIIGILTLGRPFFQLLGIRKLSGQFIKYTNIQMHKYAHMHINICESKSAILRPPEPQGDPPHTAIS